MSRTSFTLWCIQNSMENNSIAEGINNIHRIILSRKEEYKRDTAVEGGESAYCLYQLEEAETKLIEFVEILNDNVGCDIELEALEEEED